ncbi:MAG TPA: response regulator [Bacteroidota bacterium]|jgi:two-component system response regulator (stage 0 sporulation protein F)|nr:response regulator [Bacteroidota bacterium]
MPPKIKLLIVDDEEALRTIMKDELNEQGYEVSDADGGPAALEILQKNKHDVVILDVRMEGMDGLQVLKEIRTNNLARKVIMLTGVDELKIARESLDLGADDFMTKPFQFQNLFACIQRVLHEA